MKTCKHCKIEKEMSEYYANDSNCKLCRIGKVGEYRARNIEKIRAYDRERGNRQSIEYLKKYRAENTKKYKAHNTVNNAIRDKKLFREPCEICGANKSVAHHDDYAKPLNVRWLCQAHHKQWHAENGEGLNA